MRSFRMLMRLGTVLIACGALAQGASEKLLTPAIINQPGGLVSPGLSHIAWRPGTDEISYIHPLGAGPDAPKALDIFNAATRKETVLLSSEGPGPSVDLGSYVWSPHGHDLMFQAGRDLWLYNVAANHWRRLVSFAKAIEYPEFSPEREWVSFVSGNNLYAISRKEGGLEPLTTDGSVTIFNGKLDWVYEEELADRATSPAYVWSPDGREIAYLRLDDGPVPIYPITSYLSTHVTVFDQRYPQAGDANPIPSFHVVSVGSAQPAHWDYRIRNSAVEYFSPDFSWTPDSSAICFMTLNRAQTEMELHAWQPGADKDSILLTEHDGYWINARYAPVFVRQGKEFLWLSERDGWMHLYLYQADGKLVRKLTEGDWMIDRNIFSSVPIFQVDSRKGLVYFASTDPDPRQRQIWRVPLAGGAIEPVTHDPGMHSIRLSPDGKYLVDTFSDYRKPPVTRLLNSDGALLATIYAPANHLANYVLGTTRLVTVRTPGGTRLYARILLPPDFNPRRKYPVIVYVYGGPELQVVQDRWGVSSPLDQLFADNGFIVWSLDNRGSWGRGHAWESVIFEHMGGHELADQLTGVAYLKSMPYVDSNRIGIWGWSYGGYMTLYALTHAPGVFKCGAAGGPVTAWKLYDTIYTERYMRTPRENPAGYRDSSPLYFADRLKAPVLLIHGAIDDNVHMQNTMNFVEALVKANKPFELYIQPDQKHGFQGQTVRTYLDERLLRFFMHHLEPRLPAQ